MHRQSAVVMKKPTKTISQGIQIYLTVIPTEFNSKCTETLTTQALLIDSFREELYFLIC